MTNPNTARHRAPRRTALSVPSASTLGTGATRGIAAMTSTGLLLTMAATSATAVGQVTALRATTGAQAREVLLTAEARSALAVSPVVAVPADIAWQVEDISVTSEPAPEPEPEPEPAPVAQAQSSRAGARAAAPSTAPATSAPAAAAAPAPSASASAIVNYARQFLGVPYVWGGTTPSGFDCSGFTQYVYGRFGISLPRSSSAQASAGVRVSAAEARPGDLVWWPGHVGIYTGNGNNIAARNPGTPLTEGPIYNSSPTFIRVG